MIITLTNTAVDNINALRSIHGKVDIEVNGFDIDSAVVEGDYVEFWKEGLFVFAALFDSTVDLKVWKEIIK